MILTRERHIKFPFQFSFSFRIYLVLQKNIITYIIKPLCYANIFVGVLRDTSIPMAPIAYPLSASQNRLFQYIMDLLSTMEPVSDEYLEQEQDDIERSNVSKNFAHHAIYHNI